MCLHPAPEDAEHLWCSDAGWQTVPDAWISESGDGSWSPLMLVIL